MTGNDCGERQDRGWQDACAAALARLPGMGPAALVSILRERDPAEAWEMVLRGELERPTRSRSPGAPTLFGPGVRGRERSWASAASRIDVGALWDRALKTATRVTWFGQQDYPEPLLTDPNPPGVLFWRGSLESLTGRRVAIVGTRNATPDGRAIAFELGRDLALAGVCVVSGLALGIDGAAHQGVLAGLADGEGQAVGKVGEGRGPSESSAARPIGVAASGVDVPYPRQHTGLWERVCRAGAVISETPPGQPAQAWRFPTRNRIIAALSQMVVVVESHSAGGSLITAEAALERGVEVRAVPGPVRSPASEGSNQLLYDGPGPVRTAQDVLDALGVFLPTSAPSATAPPASYGPGAVESAGPGGRRGQGGRGGQGCAGEPLDSSERAVLDAVGWRPSSVGQVVERSGLGVGAAAVILDQLEARGLVGREGGWWVRVKVGSSRR